MRGVDPAALTGSKKIQQLARAWNGSYTHRIVQKVGFDFRHGMPGHEFLLDIAYCQRRVAHQSSASDTRKVFVNESRGARPRYLIRRNARTKSDICSRRIHRHSTAEPHHYKAGHRLGNIRSANVSALSLFSANETPTP